MGRRVEPSAARWSSSRTTARSSRAAPTTAATAAAKDSPFHAAIGGIAELQAERREQHEPEAGVALDALADVVDETVSFDQAARVAQRDVGVVHHLRAVAPGVEEEDDRGDRDEEGVAFPRGHRAAGIVSRASRVPGDRCGPIGLA